MTLIIDIDDNDYELLNKAGITIDWDTAVHGKEKDRKLTFAIFDLITALKDGTLYNPQGEYFDISKLRLMTVEECAGHTIDYAMGWKACIEWIKKGGAKKES